MTPSAIQALSALALADPEHLLKPAAVVEVAANPASPLHPYFQWDDAKAGYAYRLAQARTLIRTVYVLNPEALKPTPTIAYVSLATDRTKPGGGYRAVPEVLASATLRASLLQTAQKELEAWMCRHAMLTELVEAVARAAQIKVPAAARRKQGALAQKAG